MGEAAQAMAELGGEQGVEEKIPREQPLHNRSPLASGVLADLAGGQEGLQVGVEVLQTGLDGLLMAGADEEGEPGGLGVYGGGIICGEAFSEEVVGGKAGRVVSFEGARKLGIMGAGELHSAVYLLHSSSLPLRFFAVGDFWCECRYHFPEGAAHVVSGTEGVGEEAEVSVEGFAEDPDILQTGDPGVVGGLRALVGHDQLFVELLAGAKADVLDSDIGFGLETGQADHILGEIRYLDGLAHVEDEDLAAVGHGAGLDHEPGRFGDRHEVAGHIRVRDGDGSSLLNLVLEEGDHAAVGAEDIAEADGGIARRVRFRGEGADTVGGVGEALDHELAHALRGAHDVGGVDGLVRGDQDEPLDTVGGGGQRGLVGAEDVVLDGFLRIVLHQGHVLVGGGVEDDVGVVAREGGGQLLLVADAPDDHREGDLRVASLHLEVEGVGVVLVDVVDQEPLRGEAGGLAHDLGPYGPRTARDKHRAALQVRLRGLRVHVDGGSAEEVLRLNGGYAQIRLEAEQALHGLDVEKVLGDHLLDLAARGQADLEDLAQGVGGGPRDGDHDAFDAVALYYVRDAVAVAADAGAVEAQAALAGVVVYESDDVAADARVVREGVQEKGTGLPCPDDQGAGTRVRTP